MPIRAYRATASGLTCVTFAPSAGRARTNVVRAANDAGYKTGYPDVRLRRAKEYDALEKIAAAHAARGTCFDSEYLGKLVADNDMVTGTGRREGA